MRQRVLIFSLVSAVTIVLLGGFLNAVSSFGFDTMIPYTTSYRIVATLLGVAPGFIIGLIGQGFALYDAAHRRGIGWFIGLLAWPFVPLLVASLMFTGVLAHAVLWFLALAFMPLAALVYALVAPPQLSAATTNATPAVAAPVRLGAFVSVLILVTLGGAVLLFPGAQSGITVTSGPPALQVTQSSGNATCASAIYPTITVTNTGKTILQWTATTQDSNVKLTPSSGSLAPGDDVTVSLSGATSAPDVIVQFQAGGQTEGTAKFGCQ